MDIDGSNKTNITNNAAWDVLKDISPDGTKMAFTSLRTGRAEIYVMNLADSSVTQLTNEAFSDYGTICFMPDGLHIIYST